MYIQFRPVQPEDSVDVEDGVTIDLDGDGHIVGLEVINASDRFGLEALFNVTIENMAPTHIPG